MFDVGFELKGKDFEQSLLICVEVDENEIND